MKKSDLGKSLDPRGQAVFLSISSDCFKIPFPEGKRGGQCSKYYGNVWERNLANVSNTPKTVLSTY
jgi:hypothetical protein